MSSEVIVLPNDPNWITMFRDESRHIMNVLGDNAVAAHHIGSTAIPSIVAKPIIDILIAVNKIELVDACNQQMQDMGYEIMGEYGIPTRRYFRKDDAHGRRTHHVHIFTQNSPQVERHIAFRDFMNAHPTWATQYSELKVSLVSKFPNSMQDYHDGKSDFIIRIDQMAAAWRRGEKAGTF